jgi:peptide/nickel transport system substrate-binding protein
MSSSFTFRRATLAAIAAAAALTLAACSGSPAPAGEKSSDSIVTGFYGGDELKIGDPTAGGHLSYGLTIPVASVDPAGIIGGAGMAIAAQVFDTLLRVDGKGEIVGSLAKSVTSDNNTTWTMVLEQGVEFSDGTPFNAAAVLTHLTNVAKPGSMSLQAGDARAVTSMKATDDHTIVFELAKPNANFPLNFTDGSMSLIPSPTAFAAAGNQFGLAPVGAGPFTITSFEPNGAAEFAKNENYWIDGLPYLDTLTFTPVLEDSARLAALQSGDLDVASFHTPTDAKAAEAAGLVVLEEQWYSTHRILPNTTKAPFDDVRVREAMVMAIDYAAVNQVAAGAADVELPGMLTTNHPNFDPKSAFPGFDAKAATKLIAEYEKETGTEVSFELLHTQNASLVQAIALVQQMFKDVGIDMTTSIVVPGVLVGSALSGAGQAVVIETGAGPETFRRTAQTMGTNAGLNFGRGGDPAMDKLIDQSLNLTDASARDDIIDEMQKVTAKWLPYMHVLNVKNYRVVTERVQGFPDGVSNPNSFDWFEAKYAWVAQD